ncbi:MAG: hypothetical protein QG634_320, partial [Patescibacteria group bacterium]|nr:hypothetical protein [Patescibacteria group bacterium]
MPDLARFLKSIGIDLQGEENPYLKTIILTKKINKTPESKEVKIEIMVDEEIGREYHIYP